MSLFNWFSGKPVADAAVSGKAQPGSERSGQAGGSDSRPVAPPLQTAADTPVRTSGAHKSHRHAKRELLYTAVREAMIRAGVLSASYKFKVLSLDPRGEQFMVMMDLSQEFGGQAERLAEIEVMIAQGAKSRYNIRVTAVYWRLNELVAVVKPAALPEPAMAALKPSPAARRYEPIQADEVAAFKQALAAASAQGVPVAESGALSRSTPHSYTLLTGFEDTEMADSPALVPALSATQYGDLR